MKKIFLFLFLIISANVFSQSYWKNADKKTYKIIEKCFKLEQQRKYLSAYTLLINSPQNDFILAKELDILLSYFAKSMMHQMFALVDLKPGQTIEELRIGDGNYNFIEFDPVKIFSEYENKNGESAILEYQLGAYYFDVAYNYQGVWLESDLEILSKSAGLIKKAYLKGVDEKNALKLAYYALSDCYVDNKKYAEAINAINEVAKLTGDDEKVYYEKCWVYLSWNKIDDADLQAMSLVKIPKNNEELMKVIFDTAGLYLEKGKVLELQKLFEKIVAANENNRSIIAGAGSLFFYLYQMDIVENKAAAKIDLDYAEKYYSKIFEPDSEPLNDIKKFRKNL